MAALILLLLAMATAVLLQSFVRDLLRPRRWVTTGRPRLALAKRRALSRRTMMSRCIAAEDAAIDTSSWENEGGSVGSGVGPKA
jgi:hypothetical protein